MQREKKKKRYGMAENIHYIYRFLFRRYPHTKFLLAGLVLLVTVTPLISNVTVAAAVASVTDNRGVQDFVLRMGAVMLVLCVCSFLQQAALSWSNFYTECVQSRDFLMGLVRKSLDADYENVESQKQQRLLNQASHAVNLFRMGVGMMYQGMPTLISTVAGTVIYSMTISVLDIRILLVILVMTAVGLFMEKRARGVEESLKEERFRSWGRAYYLKREAMSVQNGKDIRIYNMTAWLQDGLLRLGKKDKKLEMKRHISWNLVSVVEVVFIVARDLLAYAILAGQVLDGRMSLAEFTFCLGIVSGISGWIRRMRGSWAALCDGNRMMRDYRKMMDYPNRFLREGGLPAEAAVKEGGAPQIELRNVSFRYEEDGEDILKEISLTIKAGERVALVGHNGAGKSTLVKLLCGFYHPTGGEILVGGHSIEEYNLQDYYRLLGIVFQESNTLPLSITSNVSGECEEDTDPEKVKRCLEQAGLLEDVLRLENGVQTHLTKNFRPDGIELSGGMLQKLMLARALYKDAPVLILDEPTAALDPIAESRVYQEYARIAEGKTAIFISHRLASTRFCDRILFLEDGVIREEGTHEELLQRGGRYAEMFQIQSKYYQEEM